MLRLLLSSGYRRAAAGHLSASRVPPTATFTMLRSTSQSAPTSSSASSSSSPAHDKHRGGKQSASRKRRPRGRRSTSPKVGKTTANDGRDAEERRPRSLDIAAEEASVDVERHFPGAMSFLRQPSRSPYASEEAKKRQWHDITHDVNVDGAPVPHRRRDGDDTAAGRSFFDEGSLDIRGGLRDRARNAGMDLPQREDALSPDILNLTGGSASLHGLALASKSNAAPADETIEGDASDESNNFGDTPVELTDMLRERLMELKAERISEERNETFMPRRLKLATDAQVARRSRTPVLLLEHARKAESAQEPQPQQRTLADLVQPAAAGATTPGTTKRTAVARDGFDVSAALPLAQSATAYAPGGLYAGDVDKLLSLDHTAAAPGAGDSDGARESPGCVFLLRLLPRAGFCSRREAAAVIASGQVTVGGVVERNPFRLVRAEEDVHVAGHQGRLRVAPPRLWMYHKPANVVVSRNDPAGRRLITRHANILGFDHLIPVGSLPMRSHGILMLTNDGELSRYLENPQTMIQHTYLLRVRPAIDPSLAQKLNENGININGRQYRQAEFLVNPAMKSRFSVKVKVRGETLPISHLMQHLGRVIERGGRVSFGPFSLGTLAVGSVREATVPPHYMEHIGALWKPFVERDWPYFRRQRVGRLRRLCRYRELTPKELEELDNFMYEEVQDALSLEEHELTAAADARAAMASHSRPAVPSAEALPFDFPVQGGHGAARLDDDAVIVEDITRLH